MLPHAEYAIPHHDAIKDQAVAYMKELHGWCSEEKASILIDLILKMRPQVIVEIGVFGGKSLVPMAYALKANKTGKIYGIDPWSTEASVEGIMKDDILHFWSWIDHESILQDLKGKIEEFALSDQIELIRSTSEDAGLIQDIDILHIDGNHSDAASYLDATKWVPQVVSGGLIIFDDIDWTENDSNPTFRAVKWMNEHCVSFAEFTENGETWGIWIKP